MNELVANPIKSLLVLITILGAVFLLGSVIVKNNLVRPKWVTQATVLAAVFVLLWSFPSLFLIIRKASISSTIDYSLTMSKTFFGGMGAGILITVLISGSLKRRGSQTTSTLGLDRSKAP